MVPAVLIRLLQQTLLIGTDLLGGTAREQLNARFFFRAGSRTSIFPIIIGKTFDYELLYRVHALYYFTVVYRFYHFPLGNQPFGLF